MNNIRKIQYNCRHATYLIEKKQHTPLTIKERVHLLIHLSGCSVCRLFQQQSRMISRVARQLFQRSAGETHSLDDGFKQQMQERINEKLRK